MELHNMTLQGLVVAALVGLSFAYAAWALLPQALWRGVAGWLLKRPVVLRSSAGLVQRLQRVALKSSSCACDGCDRAPVVVDGQMGQSKPVRIYRRMP